MLTSLFFLVLLLALRPYERDEDDILAICAQLLLTIVFFAGILMKLFDDLVAAGGPR